MNRHTPALSLGRSRAGFAFRFSLVSPGAHAAPWRRLAQRAKVAAAAGDEGAPNQRVTAKTRLPFTSVCPVAALISSRLAAGVKKIGNRRAAHRDGALQDFPKSLAKAFGFRGCEACTQLGRMNPGAPQTFIGIDVSDAAQDALVEK